MLPVANDLAQGAIQDFAPIIINDSLKFCPNVFGYGGCSRSVCFESIGSWRVYFSEFQVIAWFTTL